MQQLSISPILPRWWPCYFLLTPSYYLSSGLLLRYNKKWGDCPRSREGIGKLSQLFRGPQNGVNNKIMVGRQTSTFSKIGKILGSELCKPLWQQQNSKSPPRLRIMLQEKCRSLSLLLAISWRTGAPANKTALDIFSYRKLFDFPNNVCRIEGQI